MDFPPDLNISIFASCAKNQKSLDMVAAGGLLYQCIFSEKDKLAFNIALLFANQLPCYYLSKSQQPAILSPLHLANLNISITNLKKMRHVFQPPLKTTSQIEL